MPIAIDPVTRKEQTVAETENYDDYGVSSYDEQQEALAMPDKVWERAEAANLAGDLKGLGDALREYLKMTTYQIANEWQSRRNTAVDLLDAIAELKQGADAKSVIAYTTARLAFHNHLPDAEKLLPANSDNKNLKDNWEYLRAAVLYNSERKEEALAAFKIHSSRFPHSEKNEAVRYMIAKIELEQSHSFGTDNCGIQGKAGWEHTEIDPAKIADPALCRDDHWKQAVYLFTDLIRKNPNGRYSNDARGWLAFLHKRGGERAEALVEYYRLLGQSRDMAWRLEAKKSLQVIGHEYDDATLDKVESLIADEPGTALAYAYHRIYNHAIDLSYTEFNDWCCYGDDKWTQQNEEENRVKKAQDEGRHELERVARFATAMVKRYGSSRTSGDFLLRVAEAQLELQNYKDAFSLAAKALLAGVQADSRAQALWVKGSAEHQQKKLTAARSTFSQLIREFPDHKLTEGARRLLAITAEDQDDLEFALDQYIALGYRDDVAYFIDVLLPTDRLAKYVSDHAGTTQYNEFLYALGVRYMRDHRWKDARETLQMVRTEKGSERYLEYDSTATWFFAKEPDYQDNNSLIIKTSWVVQDLKTIDVFEYYENAVENAPDNQKAEATYQLASRYFEADDLAFYNPSAWKGGRVARLGELIFSDHERLPNESRIIFENMLGHDPMVTSINIYEDIAARYPRSKVARDALYTAAVAHERLSGRNSLWSTAYERGLFAGPRYLSYADIRSIYPEYQLPRGTYGWKPSTRSVNGGPGWAPPPTPMPKVSKADRAKRKLETWYLEYEPTIKGLADSFENKLTETVTPVRDRIVFHLYLMLAGLFSVMIWANRGLIKKIPLKRAVTLSRDYLVVACCYLADRVTNALPRLSLLYLAKRLYEYVKGKVR